MTAMATVMINDSLIAIEFGPWERMFMRPVPARRSRARGTAGARHPPAPERRPRREKGPRGVGARQDRRLGAVRRPPPAVAATRDQPGVHLILDRARSGGEFDEIVLSVPDADRLVAAIRRAAG